jgi:ATPase subunit of ABC transporter with duplicated ATPase domains
MPKIKKQQSGKQETVVKRTRRTKAEMLAARAAESKVSEPIEEDIDELQEESKEAELGSTRRKRRTKAEMLAARAAESKVSEPIEEDIDELQEESKEAELGSTRRKRRTKAEMLAARAAEPVVEAVPVDPGFKLKVLDHAELKSLKSEQTGFSVSVNGSGKEVLFNFDTYKERVIVQVPIPKSGYPVKYMFTVPQFLDLLTKVKPEKT